MGYSRPRATLRVMIRLVALAVAVLVLAECGADARASGPATPEQAVSRFLAVTSRKVDQSGDAQQAQRRVHAFWRRACDAIDPELRSLRFYADAPVTKANCGAAVVVLAMYTGETGDVPVPRTISGRPLSSRVTGATAIVKTAVDYEPGTSATVNVLVVKRDGEWWLATPQALNPVVAADGGLGERKLRSEYRRLLAASRRRP
jgi:hypothetical protein